MESKIKDIALAPSGHDKINWVKNFMPVMNAIEKEYSVSKPLAGKRMVMTCLFLSLTCAVIQLAGIIKTGEPVHYYLGGWHPPYGIEFINRADNIPGNSSQYYFVFHSQKLSINIHILSSSGLRPSAAEHH